MGQFKKLFTEYIDNHGDKPLSEAPFECQLLAFGMYLGRNAESTVYANMQSKLYEQMEEYYKEEMEQAVDDWESEHGEQ